MTLGGQKVSLVIDARMILTCPPRLTRSYREFAGLHFIFGGVVAGTGVLRGALKLLKRATCFCGCLVSE